MNNNFKKVPQIWGFTIYLDITKMLLCLAPMDGRTDAAYRQIVSEIFLKNQKESDTLLVRTEFMSADGYWHNPTKVIDHILHLSETQSQKKIGTIVQIFGGNEEILLQTTIDIATNYPQITGIELNIGCPAPTVVKCNAGAAMMKNKKRTLDIVKKIATSIKKPFSIKTRIGLSDQDKEKQREFIIQASNVCSMITIHGRTYKQDHSGPVDRTRIYDTKRLTNPKCKIIGNGGVCNYVDASKKYQNLDGIMIGTVALGNPWIFTDTIPTYKEKYHTILRHLHLMMAYERWKKENIEKINLEKYLMKKKQKQTKYPPFPQPTKQEIETIVEKLEKGNLTSTEKEYIKNFRSPIEFRKHLFCYLKGIPNTKVFKQEVCQCKIYDDLVKVINRFFILVNK